MSEANGATLRNCWQTFPLAEWPTGPKCEPLGRRFVSRAARDKGGRRVANGGPCPEFAPEARRRSGLPPAEASRTVDIENPGGKKTACRRR